MYQCSHRILHEERDVRLNFKGEFDGLQTFEQIHTLMPPVNCVDRVILDFSRVSRVKPIELHYLLTELADDPCFNNVEIRVEGLRFSYMETDCPNAGARRFAAQTNAGSYDRLTP